MLAVPHLIKTKGSIVNVSSINGIRVVSPYDLYNFQAVMIFTKSFAHELYHFLIIRDRK